MLAIFILTLLSTQVSGRFRAVCTSAIVDNERVDPIVNFGEISGHAHTVVGGNAFSAKSKGKQMREDSTCTSCDITADKSGYWVPSLYNQLPDGRFEAVPFKKINAYYMVDPGRYPDLLQAKAPPPGYEVLFGDPSHREDSQKNSVRYHCKGIGGERKNDKKFGGEFPPASQDCPTLRADVSGPQCSNGEARNDDDHVSHTLVQAGNKKCPPSHPIRIISQKIESYWDLSGIATPRKLVWAHGDTTGFGFHGDFVNGWDQKVLEDAVNLCDIRDGLEDQFRDNSNCNLPALTQSKESMETCAAEYQSSLPDGRLVRDEVCTGVIDELCGGASVSPVGGFGQLKALVSPAPSYNPTSRSVPRREIHVKKYERKTVRKVSAGKHKCTF
jgi:hypothetical protein